MAARRSIELHVDRTDVLSNGRLMLEVGMVAMAGMPRMAAADGPGGHPARESIRTAGPRPALRLTRRGRIALTGASVLLIGVASVALATTAQADRAGQGDGRRYVTKVEIGPGQSLWTVASAYDPNADPRDIIADIRQLNELTGDQVQPGEELWVPRG
jgi:hypothetical protein